MKKRILLIFSLVLQIIYSLHIALFTKEHLTNVINDYQELYNETGEQVYLESVTKFQTNGQAILIGIAIITIIFNLLILYRLFRKKDYHGGILVVVLGLISFFINENFTVGLLSVFNVIIGLMGIRKNQKEENIKKEEQIPNNDRFLVTKSMRWLALVPILAFFFLPDVVKLLPFSYIPLSIILDMLMVLICIPFFYTELKRDIKIFWNNRKAYLKYIIKWQSIMLLVYFLVSFVVFYIKGDATQSVNQQIAESLPMLYIIPSSLIYAPLVEELVFRGSLRRLIKNNVLFILISGLSVGIIHTLYEATLFDMILLSLPYATLGGFFAALYVKTENCTSSMISHFIHNAIACIMILLG